METQRFVRRCSKQIDLFVSSPRERLDETRVVERTLLLLLAPRAGDILNEILLLFRQRTAQGLRHTVTKRSKIRISPAPSLSQLPYIHAFVSGVASQPQQASPPLLHPILVETDFLR